MAEQDIKIKKVMRKLTSMEELTEEERNEHFAVVSQKGFTP